MRKELKVLSVLEELKQLRNYKKGFYLLMEYWDSIADEEKPKLDKQLKRLGL